MGRLQKEKKRAGKKSKRKSCGKIEEIRDFSSIGVYKNGKLLEDVDGRSIENQTMLLRAVFQDSQSS
jgi:hypothetical protein